MNIYKHDIPLGKLKKKSLKFKTTTNFSEPVNLRELHGLHLEYSDKREVLYLYPETKSGKHKLRWISIEKNDVPELIKALKELI